MAYDKRIIDAIIRRAGQVKSPAKRNRYLRAALQTGIVESGLKNVNYGDADSLGWRQERKSLYANPTNVSASVDRFFDEAGQLDRGQRSWELAADVQRPAAQYRGRYKQVAGKAADLLEGGSDDAEPPAQRYRTTTTSTPGVDNRQARAQLIMNFLGSKKADPLEFATQARALRDVDPTSTTTRTAIGGAGTTTARGASAPGGNLAAVASQRADTIDKQKLPYSWGGGHAGRTPANKAIPLDCSGAVSKVLGIDPRVADQFKTWGRAGDGGDKGVTVYSKPTHTLMKIKGHFFGTSSTNPGGGAGWIPQDAVSDSYLAGFTARHSDR